jgi:hypothetical protein
MSDHMLKDIGLCRGEIGYCGMAGMNDPAVLLR